MPPQKKPFAEHDLRVTLHCAGKKIKPFAEHDLRVTLECAGNYADRGGFYPLKTKAEADNSLRDLHNSSYRTKAEFNDYFIIHSKYFRAFKKTKFT